MLSDYRRKNIYEVWKSKQYLSHVQRLQHIMSKTNSLGKNEKKHTKNRVSIHRTRKMPHEKTLDQNCPAIVFRKDSGQLPNITHLSPSCRASRAPHKKEDVLQLSILKQKLQNIHSDYSKTKYDQNYKKVLKLRSNIKRKVVLSPKFNLQKLYIDSSFMNKCYPDYVYTHLCHCTKQKIYDQLYLKFEKLPAVWSNYDLFSLEKVSNKSKKKKLMLFNLAQMHKDLFLFKFVSKEESRIHMQINRHIGNEVILLGTFVVWRGRNEVCTIVSRGGFDLGDFRCIAELMRVQSQTNHHRQSTFQGNFDNASNIVAPLDEAQEKQQTKRDEVSIRLSRSSENVLYEDDYEEYEEETNN